MTRTTTAVITCVLALATLSASCGDEESGSTAGDTASEPTEPTEPTEPAEPTEPVEPTEPAEPTETLEPTESAPVDVPTAVAGLSMLAPAPALILSADGFKDGASACATVDIDVVERNAENDIPSLTAIAEGFLADGVDLIATVTTPAAQAAFQVVGAAGGTTPVVFSTVNDPFAAGLAESPTVHEPWITGSQSLPPLADVLDALDALVPGIATAGIAYNPAEPNSQLVVDALQAIASGRGLTLELATVTNSSEVAQAAEALVSRGIEAFVVPTDGTVVSGMAAMVQVAGDNDLPVVGTDVNMAQTGAAIGLGADYYAAGVRAGEIACDVLSGTATPADFDIVNIESVGVAVNLAAAEAQGVTIPDALVEGADVVG